MFGASELLVILVVLIFFYGGKRVSRVGKDLVKSVTEFKKAVQSDPPSPSKEKEKP